MSRRIRYQVFTEFAFGSAYAYLTIDAGRIKVTIRVEGQEIEAKITFAGRTHRWDGYRLNAHNAANRRLDQDVLTDHLVDAFNRLDPNRPDAASLEDDIKSFFSQLK